MVQEDMEDRTNLDKIFDGKSGRVQAVAPFGIAELHAQGKIEFASDEVSNTVTISPYADLNEAYEYLDDDIDYLNTNPDSFYVIMAYNQANMDADLRAYNTWEDVDGNARRTELTSGGHTITYQESDIVPIEGLFCGNSVELEAEIHEPEGTAWNLYYNIYRP